MITIAASFEDLFAFIDDHMTAVEVIDLYRLLFDKRGSFPTDPCGECPEGTCDHCGFCRLTEQLLREALS